MNRRYNILLVYLIILIISLLSVNGINHHRNHIKKQQIIEPVPDDVLRDYYDMKDHYKEKKLNNNDNDDDNNIRFQEIDDHNHNDTSSHTTINKKNDTSTYVRKCADGTVEERQLRNCNKSTPPPTGTPPRPTPGPTHVETTYRRCEDKPGQHSEVQTRKCGADPNPKHNNNNVYIAKRIEGMVKSKEDHRIYRHFQLSNGLDVVLVSDPNATKAAAAMDVNVGYWSDPEDIAGLAHFCEHMLFLGNKKYPKEDEYSGFLSSHGGSSNAYTSYSNTNYYFDIQPKALKDALDRFAQFFIDPLFTESATGREMMAVNAEHVKNIQSDGWRTFQMIQSLALKTIPFHKFGTGNTQTLGSVPPAKLRQALLTFWQKHYHAYNMRLVILGHETVEELEKYAVEYFSDVRSDKINEKPHLVLYEDKSNNIFPPNTLPSLIHSESVKDTRSLMLAWYIPPQTPLYAKKSHDYISTLLGNEATGSLLSILKSKGYATGLSSGAELSTINFDMYQISIDLTEKGFLPANIHKIIELTYRYIKLIEQEGINKWRWNEMARISAIRFRLKNKEESQDYVSKLASTMGKFKPRDLLMAKYLYEEYDSKEIKSLLARLTPENMMVVVSAQKFPFNLTQMEPFYGVKFNVEHLNNNIEDYNLARTQPVANQTNLPEHLRMVLPQPNEFIPSSLDIKPLKNLKYPNFPILIKDFSDNFASNVSTTNVGRLEDANDGSVRIFYHQDRQFHRPRANIICKIWSRQLYSSPRDVVLASLYTKLVRDHLNELAYQAGTAGFSFSFGSDVDGYDLRISGYDSGLYPFVAKLSRFLRMKLVHDKNHLGFVPIEERFLLIKEDLMQSYRNFMFGQPHVHSSYGASLLLENPHWHISQYIQAIQDIDMHEVVTWGHGVYTDAALDCLVHGNIYENEALKIINVLQKNLKLHSDFQADRRISSQVQRVTQVDGSYIFTMKTPNPSDLNSAAYAYYQYEGMGNIVDDILIEFLAQVMEKPCFHQLRTVEQLGYIVWSGTDKRAQVPGIRIIVQSPKHNAAYLNSRIENFIKLLRTQVRSMTMEHFNEVRHSLIHSKKQPPRTLAEQSARFWFEIVTQQYKWGRRLQEIKALEKMNLPQFWKFFDVIIGFNTIPSRIGVLVNAQTGPGAVNDTKIVPVDNSNTNQAVAARSHAGVKDDSPKSRPNTNLGNKNKESVDLLSPKHLEGISSEMRSEERNVEALLNQDDVGLPHLKNKKKEGLVDTDEDGFDIQLPKTKEWDISDDEELPSNHQELNTNNNNNDNNDNNEKSTTSNNVNGDDIDEDLEKLASNEFQGLEASDDDNIADDGLSNMAEEESFIQEEEEESSSNNNNNHNDNNNNKKTAAVIHGVEIVHQEATTADPTPSAGIDTRVYYTQRVNTEKHDKVQQPKPLPLPAGNYHVPLPVEPRPTIKPDPTLSPIPRVPSDPTCNKSGPKRRYKPRPLTLINVAAFKDAMCLYPRRPVGTPITKSDVINGKTLPAV